jgi:alkane 1-monooxygenase
MFLLAYVPPLWYRVMNPRVLDLVDGDLGRVNLDRAYFEKQL